MKTRPRAALNESLEVHLLIDAHRWKQQSFESGLEMEYFNTGSSQDIAGEALVLHSAMLQMLSSVKDMMHYDFKSLI